MSAGLKDLTLKPAITSLRQSCPGTLPIRSDVLASVLRQSSRALCRNGATCWPVLYVIFSSHNKYADKLITLGIFTRLPISGLLQQIVIYDAGRCGEPAAYQAWLLVN